MTKRKLIGFCCVALALTASGALGGSSARAEIPGVRESTAQLDVKRLVREVVYNELHDHDSHGYWRYWIERNTGKETLVEEQVETSEGPVKRVEMSNGRPLGADARESEDRKLQKLLTSPSEQEQHRREYGDDERRIGRIIALLPDAFLYDPAQLEVVDGAQCYHMRFHPNPDYPARSIEARIFHAMAGDLWVSVQNKHMVRLEGKLVENVDFGYGILGRLYKDGWFRLERTRVSSSAPAGQGDGDWKTQRLEVHMNGRAMLFKTIAKETSEVRVGFMPVPSGLSLRQAASLIDTTNVASLRVHVKLASAQ